MLCLVYVLVMYMAICDYRVFTHDNILPMLAVVVDPQVHIVGHYMKIGSLYNLLHGGDAGECVCLYVCTYIVRVCTYVCTYMCVHMYIHTCVCCV